MEFRKLINFNMNDVNSSTNNFDPNTVITAADARLAQGDFEGGQLVYQSALLDWVDHARETAATTTTSTTTDAADVIVVDPAIKDAITTLWLSYALFLRKSKQNKSAMDAYEQATACPIAGDAARIWLDYARFAEERGKKRTAQQIYLQALVGTDGQEGGKVTDDQDRQLLWQEFLRFMQTSNPQLTMTSLQTAVEKEHLGGGEGGNTSTLPLPGSVSPVRSNSPGPPPSKKSRWGTDIATGAGAKAEGSKTHVVTVESVEAEAQELLQKIDQPSLPPEIAAAWMVRDGDTPPQPPEPPLFGPTPPKLSDPTGKDILGEELALSLMQRLLKPSGTAVLKVCRALWMMTALQEQQATKAMDRLDQSMTEEYESLEATLESRLAVAGAAHSAVVQMNEKDRQNFAQHCQEQRTSTWSDAAWQYRLLLCVQQTLLAHLKVPGFDGPTVDAAALELQARICSFLHSAFYLRNRIGEDPHKAMLKSQEERLQKMLQDPNRTLSPVPPFGGSSVPPPHSVGGFGPPPPPPSMVMPPPPPPHQQYPGYPGQQQQPPGGYGQVLPPPPQQQQQQQQHQPYYYPQR